MKEGKRHGNSLKRTKFCLMEVSTRENKETIGQGTMKAVMKENVPETFEGNRDLQLPRPDKGTSLETNKQITVYSEPRRLELRRSSYTWNFFQLTVQFKPSLFKGQCHGWEPVCGGLTVIIRGFLTVWEVCALNHPELFKGQP